MLQRLGIVVPYRDREQHLSKLLPHLLKYFARDAQARNIPVSIIVVEQDPGLPFNRGLICNIGNKLASEKCDYVCFHDVDWLPIWADYSSPANPTMIIKHGFEERPIDPDNLDLGLVTHDIDALFSAVVLCPNNQFAQANGFSNDYWGWGFEDMDLANRFSASNIQVAHRAGTFTALDHKHNGYQRFDAQANALIETPQAQRNRATLSQLWNGASAGNWKTSGLNSVSFEIAMHRSMETAGMERPILVEHFRVGFPNRP